MDYRSSSYYHCIGKVPLVSRTVGQQLALVAETYGKRDAVVAFTEMKRLTYDQLLRKVVGHECEYF